MLDTLAYKTFKKLKDKFSVKTILLTDHGLSMQGLHLSFPTHREYIKHLFFQEGVEVTRFAHNYASLDTANPELGLVFMVNDSVIVPGVEVHALIGHNARYMTEEAHAV